MPARSDLDPLEIPGLLRWIMLIDVLRNPRDFRYRLIGTGVTERLGYDLTGAHFSDLAHHKPPTAAFELAQAIVAAARPGWAGLPYLAADRAWRMATVVALPLGDVTGVTMLLYGMDFPSLDEEFYPA